MLNRVVLIGRLTRDPELRYTPQGTPVASFGLAVNRKPSKDGERQADFIDIVAWRQTAEFVGSYLTKGRLVAVEGRLQIRDWVAQDGTKRRSAEVVADSVQGLDKARADGDSSGYSAAPAVSDNGAPDAEPDFDAYDDPFRDE